MVNLLYGQDKYTGYMISVYDANNGLKCQCICPYCQNPLIAKQGADKKWHFAHASKIECAYAGETTIHELAKYILLENQYIVLPNGKNFYYTEVKIERKLHDTRPDAWVSNGAESIAVEIFVTHAVEPGKLKKLREKKITMLEIDLSGVSRQITKNDLAKIVIDGQDLKMLHTRATTTPDNVNSDDYSWIGKLVFFISAFFFLLFLLPLGMKRRR